MESGDVELLVFRGDFAHQLTTVRVVSRCSVVAEPELESKRLQGVEVLNSADVIPNVIGTKLASSA